MEETDSGGLMLSVYPNPSDSMINLKFLNIRTFPTKVDIYNARGEKIYTELISKTGNFTLEENLKKLRDGVYIIKYSKSEKPVIFIIQRH